MAGTGQLTILGADLNDPELVGEAIVAEALLRLRAYEIQTWLKFSTVVECCRDKNQDVVLCVLPKESQRTGASSSLAMFLAILKLYLKNVGLRIRAKMAVTGVLSLRGRVLRVTNIVAKVRGALDGDCDLVLVPMANQQELKNAVVKVTEEGGETKGQDEEERRKKIISSGKLTDEEWANKVRMVDDVVDVFEHGIEGRSSQVVVDA